MTDRNNPEDGATDRGKWGRRVAYFTPFHSMRRAGASMVAAKARISETFHGFKNSLPARDPNAVYADDDARNIIDAAERFKAMYEINGWSPLELEEQMRACSRTKVTSLSVALIALVITFGALFFAPLWMLFFILPIGGSAVILGLAQAFKFALYETQIDLRSLIDAKTFFARDDFFTRMVG